MRLLAPLCIVMTLIGASLPALWAQDGDATAMQERSGTPAEWRQQLGGGELLLLDEDTLRWAHPSGKPSFAVVDVEQGRAGQQIAILDSAAGSIRVASDLIRDADALAVLPTLVERAQSAGVIDAELRYDESILTGRRLRGDGVLVLPEDLLRKADDAQVDQQQRIDRVAAAGQALRDELDASALDHHARKTVAALLKKLPLPPSNAPHQDRITPEFARQVVRHGWLDQIFTQVESATALASAVAAAERFEPALAFVGETTRIQHVQDAFGATGWVMFGPERNRLLVPAPLPMYHWPAQKVFSEALVVIDLPPGSDPVDSPDAVADATAVRLYHNERLLAGWSREQGFNANKQLWRRLVPASGNGLDSHIVSNYLPPHIVLRDLNGDVHGIFTAQGLLRPPRNGGKADADRFLGEAAELLPDAAYLDLIGQYLFKYTYDSPDSRFPFVLGTKETNSDIHQTAYETLATASGGVCRGDCDDLSEFYQNIVARQGKTAHVISLPAHAAVAWAELQGEAWHVFVMQTGPTLEFAAPKLPKALEMAYKRFDATDTFDPNGLGLLLRFSGENTRSAWRLSWRIFAEPDYARTMIDVQRDWHFQTYLEGIKKMERMIYEGDNDTANYRELAGLFSFTGQHQKAADYLRQAIERTPEATSRLFESVELVQHLLEAEEHDKAEAVVRDVLQNQLPPLRPQLGMSVVQFGLRLASVLQNGEAYGLAGTVVDATAKQQVEQLMNGLAGWINTRFNRREWENSGQLRQLRRLVALYATTLVTQIAEADPAELNTDEVLRQRVAVVQNWLDNIAFYDVDDASQVMLRYAQAAAFYEATLGEEQFRDMLGKAGEPDEREHEQRVGGLQQLRQDLPWIRYSIFYWSNRLQELIEGDDRVDPERIADLGEELEAAISKSAELDLTSSFTDHAAHINRLIVALIGEDEQTLRELLRHVRSKNDKRLRDDTAAWMGNTAKHLDLDWWDRVLQAWVDELDYKPKYYWIAWRAALSDAPEHALATGKLAATRFSDDQAFVNEYRFMKELLSGASVESEDGQE